MPHYRCTVCDTAGKKQVLLVQAGSTAELLEAYAGKNRFLLSYEEADTAALQDKHFLKKHKRFSRELVQEFTEIMTALLTSGNTVASSLELCGSMGVSSEGKLAELCALLLEGIRKGERFSEGLLRCSPSFSPMYVALVGIGEKTGNTAEVFKRLGSYLSTSKKIQTKVAGTLFYPVFVLVSAIVGSILILFLVMPRMAEAYSVFSTSGNAMDMGGVYTSVYILIAIIFSVGAGSFSLAVLHRYSHKAAIKIDRIVFRLPLMGVFFTAMESLDFCFAMELCSRTGLNIAVSLGEAQRVLRNQAFAQAVKEVREAAAAGGSLSQAFLARPIFPQLIGRWIAVGEQTGEGEMVFSHLKDFFEETVGSFTERFLSNLEPVLILLTGLIVLFLLLQFVLPLFSIYGVII